jgi:energy-coupling factor transport system ATP-binding protein
VSIRLEAVAYQYAGTRRSVLDGVDLLVEPGEVVGVVGGNESGKSTLCLVASGLAPVSIGGRLSGRAQLDEVETASLRPYEIAQRCGILFQNPNTQLSGTSLTVFEEVAFGPRNLGLDPAEIVRRVDSAMAAVGVSDLAARDPGRLSGGQAQLVALASVLALRPTTLVLDEPTSQLDPLGTRQVGDALATLARQTGTAILIVEHKTDLLERMAESVVVLDGGHIVERGSAAEVLADPGLAARGVDPPAAVRLGRAVEAAGMTAELLEGALG